MKQPLKLSDYRRVHFIGIGGIGMSGLARLFMHEGKTVSGSDRDISDIARALATEGATIFDTQVPENISDEVELVVYTEAMSKDHPEMVAAYKRDLPVLSYFEALGLVANAYYLIAVAGTHGKTTTTAMIVDVLEAAGLDPSAIIGSLRAKTGSNYRSGKSKYFVVEACEYRRDFLNLTPDILVITNIEAEHLDYYKDLADVQDAFRTLVSQVREGGVVICDPNDPNVAPVSHAAERRVVNYTSYVDPLMRLRVPGLHNRKNAAAALAIADVLNIEKEVASDALAAFAGTWRRFEYVGETEKGAPVYDDYGHHPTEIAVTLAGARELHPDKRIMVIFQPHLYSRTAEFFDEFTAVLASADHIILTDIYAAREENEWGVSSEQLAAAVRKKNPRTHYRATLAEAAALAVSEHTAEHLILILGAGSVTSIRNKLV